MNFGKPRRGEQHPLARLTNDQAAQIRERFNTGESVNRLSKDFGVSRPTIDRVVWRLSYPPDR